MQPNHFDLLGHGREGTLSTRQQLSRESTSRPEPTAQRLRSEDSWVEISSQPSSSSLSSNATDDIITTGLRVQHGSNIALPRRLRPAHPSTNIPSSRLSTAGSSQDEYEESESESDRVMNSSNEDIPRNTPLIRRTHSEVSDETLSDDDDGNSTALGVVSDERRFTPQPNAFSRPPAPRSNQSADAVPSYSPSVGSSSRDSHAHPHSYSSSSRRSQCHTPYNVISPSHQPDHDAALRASLSTLLSCAAAARGLPKRDQPALTSAAAGNNRVDPTTLRMVPESVLMGEDGPPRAPIRRTSHRTTTGSTSSSGSVSAVPSKGKRKASSLKDRRAAKKSKRATNLDEIISPTLMTWVISAGVVVLFSAISFSAGYALGKEVGRPETTGMMGTGESMNCGKDAMRGGWRRLRWGTGSSASVRV